jgi:hypothetical protein
VDIARGFWAKYIADEFGDDVEIGDNDRYDMHLVVLRFLELEF